VVLDNHKKVVTINTFLIFAPKAPNKKGLFFSHIDNHSFRIPHFVTIVPKVISMCANAAMINKCNILLKKGSAPEYGVIKCSEIEYTESQAMKRKLFYQSQQSSHLNFSGIIFFCKKTAMAITNGLHI
jgi:hypothetical protein